MKINHCEHLFHFVAHVLQSSQHFYTRTDELKVHPYMTFKMTVL